MNNNLPPSGICIVCGCTETDCTQCIERSGSPCSWTDETETMCTTCEWYIDTLDQVGLAYERVGRNMSKFIKKRKIHRFDYDSTQSIWNVYYTRGQFGLHKATFETSEALFKFLTADETGN